MKRAAAGIACLLGGGFLVFTEVLWMSAPREEHFGLSPLAARALLFALGLTGFVLLYAGFLLLRRRRSEVGKRAAKL